MNADGAVSTGVGLLGYNMFAYCKNNPVNMSDPNGDWPLPDCIRNDMQAWDVATGQHTLENYNASYCKPNGATYTDKVPVRQVSISSVNRKSITYIPPDKAKAVLIERLKANSGPAALDYISWISGGVIAATPFAPLSPIIWAGDGIGLYNPDCQNKENQKFESAMNKGKGVIEIQWDIEGDTRTESSWTTYEAWDGSTEYGSYPYVNP